MKIIENHDGTYTVQIARGPEVYDPVSGTLMSEETISAEEYAEARKPVPGRAPTAGDAGWLNSATLPAALRDLVHLGDSELDHASQLPARQRPAALRALDDAADQLDEAGAKSRRDTAKAEKRSPGSTARKADAAAARNARKGAPTAGAASPAAQKSPPAGGGGGLVEGSPSPPPAPLLPHRKGNR